VPLDVAYIYALCEPDTNIVRYVGKSVKPTKRLNSHCNDKATTRKGNWIRSLGDRKPELLILEEVPINDWEQYERKWIAFYREKGYDLTNHTDGGEGVSGLTEDARQRLSKARKELWNIPEKREEFLILMRSPERRAKISAANKGRPRSAEHTAKLPQNNKGWKPSPERIEKLRKLIAQYHGNRKGQSVSQETKDKLKIALQGNQHTKGRVMPQWEKDVRSAATKGRPKSEEWKAKVRGRTQSPEWKQKRLESWRKTMAARQELQKRLEDGSK